MEGKVGDGFCYNGAPEPNDFGFDKGVIEEQQSVLGNLKRSNSERASAFGSYMESQKAKEQQVIDNLVFTKLSKSDSIPNTF